MDNYSLKDMIKAVCKAAIGISVYFILVAVISVCLSSCTATKYVDRPYPVPEYHEIHTTDTLTQKDTLYVRDSVSTAKKGDTIYIERWRTKYQTKWREKEKLIVRCDSIPYEVEKKVPYFTKKEMSFFDKVQMGIGGLTLLVFVGYALYVIIKKAIKK